MVIWYAKSEHSRVLARSKIKAGVMFFFFVVFNIFSVHIKDNQFCSRKEGDSSRFGENPAQT